MSSKYSYLHLELIEPDFGSKLTDLVIELDYLRKKPLAGSTNPYIFFQLKEIFHFLESLESARIEGNRTTLAELIERKMTNQATPEEQFLEIENVESAIHFIDQNIKQVPINRMFVSELHKMVVAHLSPQREGDSTPGEYRKINVSIAKAQHAPPDFTQVPTFMQELFNFVNDPHASKFDLIKMALVHHRFVWIHPFRNGNGRAVRLLTYAMLVKQGFHVDVGRILNPTAIFCNDREKYYRFLADADSGQKADLLQWCDYVLSGLKEEIEKIDNLLDYRFLSQSILLPAVELSLDRKIITDTESKILRIAIENQIFQAGHLKSIFPNKIPAEISRLLRGLKEKKMILSPEPEARKYYINFYNSYLLRGIIQMLRKEGLIPFRD